MAETRQEHTSAGGPWPRLSGDLPCPSRARSPRSGLLDNFGGFHFRDMAVLRQRGRTGIDGSRPIFEELSGSVSAFFTR
jgi:hypothetical protein